MPEFSGRRDLSWNFAYCKIIKQKQVSIWSFSMFLDPFDWWTWLVLFLTFFVIGFLAFSRKLRYNPAHLTCLSVLFSPGISGWRKKWGKSLLFILWMFCCCVMVIFYSGVMTSKVIRPSPDEILRDVVDLEKYDYKLMIVDKSLLSAVKNSYENPQISSFERMLFENKTYFEESLHLMKLVRHLISQDRVASVALSEYAPRVATSVNDLIASNCNKRCYVGRTVIAKMEAFVAFTPPGSGELAKAYLKLDQSGINNRWHQELLAMASSKRVQDRVRVLNMTRISDERANSIIESLQLTGRMVTIFLLWSFCLVWCLLAFVLEKFFDFVN